MRPSTAKHLLLRLGALLLLAGAAGIGAGAALARTAKKTAAAKPVTATTVARTQADQEARAFLAIVVPLLQPAHTAANQVAWRASTDVTPVHTGERAGAEKVTAALAGSRVIIERAKHFLAQRADLDELTARQLDKLLLAAAEAPATIPDVVARRVEAEARQSAVQDGYTFCLEPGPGRTPCKRALTANEIDRRLRTSRDLAERERVWRLSKEIGGPLKPGLIELRDLRNQVARELGHPSFFALQVADYGMTVDEMMKLLDDTLVATRPLFDQLQCWARHTLASRYGKPAPALIPAHWLGNRWAQSWPGLVDGTSLDPLFAGKDGRSIVRAAEDFYVSLGFARLPESFWQRSDLFPVPKPDGRQKNSHASAWHVDGEQDVRSLMSVEPDQRWFGTAHHELGHVYYYLSYTRPEVPYLLRGGANRAFHEAIGELARLASEQPPYLERVGLLPPGKAPDRSSWLLASALDSLVFLPFAAGTMSHFERDLYDRELPAAAWQERWWKYAAEYQGIAPPGPRPAELCDGCTKTHVNDDPAQYYDYALATLIKFQLHDHICRKILRQDVHACDYSGHKEVGDFLRGILALGATRDWREVIQQATGEPIGPRALLSFYEPLGAELAARNAGLACGGTTTRATAAP